MKENTANCRIIEYPVTRNIETGEEEGNVDLATPINSEAEHLDGSNSFETRFKTAPSVTDNHSFSSQKPRNRKSKTEWTEEHKAFLALASVSTPRLLIMRKLALSDPAFNRHYLEALRKGEISPIPDNTVFKPSSFPKEIRAMLECGDVDLISIETAEDHLILRKI